MFDGPAYTSRMALTLDPSLEKRIQVQMTNGDYDGPSDVVARALDLLDAEREDLSGHRATLLARLEHSLQQARGGEMFSEEELKARMAERRRAAP